MSHGIFQAVHAVQALSLFALVAIFIRPHAAWSVRARLPVALIVFVCSIALLIHDIF